MAEILPLEGIMYNPKKISDFSDVVAPPYDVISQEDQQSLHNRHSHNVVRLILGKTHVDDTAENNRHTRAAGFWKKWLEEEILIKDTQPAYYLTAVDFDLQERIITRFGLIARVRVVPFEKGIILPHEKTFSKIKSERLDLMKACHANFSPIFSLYSDKQQILKTLREGVEKKLPDLDHSDSDGFRQRLWKIYDPEILHFTSEAMRDNTIYIADGHHRYETALNYLRWISNNTVDFSPTHPANFVMMSLSSIEDPGLVILPAHRLLLEVGENKLNALVEKAKQFFRVEQYPFDADNFESRQNAFLTALKTNLDSNAVGYYAKNSSVFYLFILKPGIMDRVFKGELPAALAKLDVTVLTRLIFMALLGFDQARLDNDRLIGYSSIDTDAIEQVRAGKYDAAFILNPTKIDQVQEIAHQQLIMPRKSTYFFPKVISGQVMNSLS